MRTILSIVLLTLILSCTRESEPVLLGVYSGECTGLCCLIVQVNNHESRIDVSQTFMDYHFEYADNYVFVKDSSFLLPEDDHEYFKELIQNLPKSLNDYTNEIGCPDCMDQGGIFLRTCEQELLIDPEWENDPEILKLSTQLTKRLMTIHRRYYNRRN